MAKQETLIRKEHHDRDDLVGEHRLGDLGQTILLIIFLIVWIADSFFLHYSTELAKSISLYIRFPVAVGFLFCAYYLARKGLKVVFGEEREKPVVIREGVFNIVRHPIYLGAILIYVGLFTLTFSLLSLIVLFIILFFYHFIARYEEKLLLQQFGKDYEKYKKEVPMWLPKLTKQEEKR
jgi:protein-S-isoprenylcysteine O-methyltransferase Ste14